ncbi:MAG: MFS transporter [Oligoflexia bacterium]|nr:MFS transporter [Oligoflexia bacterium]
MNAALIVAALGYFVDVFDILLFSILRVPSLKELGLTDQQVLETGLFILNLQLAGLISGGILWGIWGDKYGRLSVLFGSILLYSGATFACAFVHDVNTYAALRFVAGFGLAGELGVGITLVSELLPSHKRGWGTTFVTAVGVAGAIAGGVLGESLHWRTCYGIGGVLGLFLLIARFSVAESSAFLALKERSEVSRGNILLLFSSFDRLKRYLLCVLLGFPIMYVVYVLVTFSPEVGRSQGMSEPISAARAVLFCYIGITAGDFFFGAASQWIKSRRRSSFLSLASLTVALAVYWRFPPTTPTSFYWYAVVLGFCSANWAVLVTSVAEQFGTNLRATVTTSIPNMIRGSAILLTLGFNQLKTLLSPFESVVATGFISLAIAVLALMALRETYGNDLNFVEK